MLQQQMPTVILKTEEMGNYLPNSEMEQDAMQVIFVVLAILILLLYSPYLLAIFRGRGEAFENLLQAEMSEALAVLLENPWRTLLPILAAALIFEAGYFISAWISVNLWGFRLFTSGFILFELFHVCLLIVSLFRYIRGQQEIESMIKWKLERFCALMFSAHAILGLLFL
ncbi:MAG: hypothetical protein GXY50_10270 [Syntrophomonadaceae bacterium]|nr:hypothetical protein [Syntrophomonadaceae bacterium]